MRAGWLVLLLGMSSGPSRDVFIESENSRRPLAPWSSPAAGPADSGAPGAGSTAYHWAAFTGVLDDPARSRLAGLGVEVLGFAGRPGPYQLYKVRIQGRPARVFDSLKALPAFVNLLPILPEEKMSRKVFQGRFEKTLPGGKVKATVFFHRFENRAWAEALLAGKVDRVLADPDPRMVHVVGSPERVLALAELDEVARVEDFLERLPLRPRPAPPGSEPGR